MCEQHSLNSWRDTIFSLSTVSNVSHTPPDAHYLTHAEGCVTSQKRWFVCAIAIYKLLCCAELSLKCQLDFERAGFCYYYFLKAFISRGNPPREN